MNVDEKLTDSAKWECSPPYMGSRKCLLKYENKQVHVWQNVSFKMRNSWEVTLSDRMWHTHDNILLIYLCHNSLKTMITSYCGCTVCIFTPLMMCLDLLDVNTETVQHQYGVIIVFKLLGHTRIGKWVDLC